VPDILAITTILKASLTDDHLIATSQLSYPGVKSDISLLYMLNFRAQLSFSSQFEGSSGENDPFRIFPILVASRQMVGTNRDHSPISCSYSKTFIHISLFTLSIQYVESTCSIRIKARPRRQRLMDFGALNDHSIPWSSRCIQSSC
jgi:hypothetical protein